MIHFSYPFGKININTIKSINLCKNLEKYMIFKTIYYIIFIVIKSRSIRNTYLSQKPGQITKLPKTWSNIFNILQHVQELYQLYQANLYQYTLQNCLLDYFCMHNSTQKQLLLQGTTIKIHFCMNICTLYGQP